MMMMQSFVSTQTLFHPSVTSSGEIFFFLVSKNLFTFSLLSRFDSASLGRSQHCLVLHFHP